jgi:hypothetical protein
MIWIPALVFTGASFLFLGAVFFLVPNPTASQSNLLWLIFSAFTGFAALFWGGSAQIKIGLPKKSPLKFAFSATGGIALFVFVYTRSPWWANEQPSPRPIRGVQISDAGSP